MEKIPVKPPELLPVEEPELSIKEISNRETDPISVVGSVMGAVGVIVVLIIENQELIIQVAGQVMAETTLAGKAVALASAACSLFFAFTRRKNKK